MSNLLSAFALANERNLCKDASRGDRPMHEIAGKVVTLATACDVDCPSHLLLALWLQLAPCISEHGS